MKKFVTLVLTLLLAASLLTGCAVSIPKGLTGIDASKLLLARERLNPTVLYGADSIFESGAAAYANLSRIADESLAKLNESSSGEIKLLSYSPTKRDDIVLAADKSMKSKDGSLLEITGDTYEWSNFAEYSNSYDYFLNITGNIKSSAEMGAKLIDNVKKRVRIVDTWVEYWGTEYYLHVEENSEILISRDSARTGYDICMRYKRDDGANVYELYTMNMENDSNMRSKYIPGEHFYYSYHVDGYEHDFFAENTKGFWEIVGFAGSDPNFQVSCTAFKDDVCYDAVYDVGSQSLFEVNIISSDKNTDILSLREGYYGTEVQLHLQAFDGYKHVALTADDSQVSDNFYDDSCVIVNLGDTFTTSGRKSATLVLENGITLTEGDEFFDGKIVGKRNDIKHFGKENGTSGYVATASFTVADLGHEEAIPVIKEFLNYLGLECRRDIDVVLENAKRAYVELSHFTKYHKWNDSLIYTTESIRQGYANNDAKFKEFRDMYDAVKDVEVIKANDVGAISSRMTFPVISAQTAEGAVIDGNTVYITNLELEIDDTLLFVVDEPYVVNFALVSTNSETGLIHIETEKSDSYVYGGEETFKIKASASFALPEAAVGEYTLVAYVSTAEEEIRSSGYIPVVFTEVNGAVSQISGINVLARATEASEVIITYSRTNEIEVTVAPNSDGKHSCASMRAALEEAAYVYGYANEGAKLEMKLQDGSWAELSEDSAELEFGIYRLKFSVENGRNVYEGFVYTDYQAN